MKGIITLCGSTRFKREYEIVNRELELSDWAVFTVACYYHQEKSPELREWILRNKRKLDSLHLAKIDLPQAIVIIDVGGYIGKSTKSEIQHAKKRNKPIYLWSDDSWRKLLGE